MIVILNGALGVGKTTTSWELSALFDRSVMLDGDYLGAFHPFEIYDADRVKHLYRTLAHVVAFHQGYGYDAFVINYVFETPEDLAHLRALLEPLDRDIHAFWLTCDAEELRERVRDRGAEDLAWELARSDELRSIQRAASRTGDIGLEVDTTGLRPGAVASHVYAGLAR